MKTYSISQLAREFNLSRSTLLHYDAIGLLKAPQRTASNYRVYTEIEFEKLGQICLLRSTGISLNEIQKIMDSEKNTISEILYDRIDQINSEINRLRFQQKAIVRILRNKGLQKSTRILTKDTWVQLLASAGLDEKGMSQWHIEFELTAPEAHQDFLESLGLSNKEINDIRNWAKNIGT